MQAVGVDAAQQATNTATSKLVIAAPTVALNVVSSTATTVTFAGTLSDIDAAGETITISGASVGSVVTDANGNYSFTTDAANLGLVSVSATDLWGDTSNTADVDLTGAAPRIIDFAAVQVYGNNFEFTGKVVGANVQGLSVNFGGLTSLNGQTTTVTDNGTFGLAQTLQPGETGTATAQTTDSMGQASNLATADVD